MKPLHLLTLLLALTAPFARAADKPNILVILADDLGYGDVQCYNPERGKIPTPNIDRLARQGLMFTDAHSSSGVCSPTRYTLLTGRYHWRTGKAGIVPVFGPPMIGEKRLTLPALLKGSGYKTAAIGKWHLGWDWPIPPGKKPLFSTRAAPDDEAPPAARQELWREVFAQPIPGGPTARGFDSYFGTDVPNWPPFCFIENDRLTGTPSAYLPQKLVGNNQASVQGPALPGWKLEEILPALTTRACAFVGEAAAQKTPFFLYLPLTSPHTPLAVADEWKGRSKLNLYADFVMQTDAAVGKVLDALEKSGAAKNTLVIFTSDNGCAPYVGAAELEKQGHFPSGPLRGYKSDAYEGGHRVPFIVRWPGVVTAGRRSAQLLHQADLLATCAEIVGAKLSPEAAEDSFSFLPVLRGGETSARDHTVNQSSGGLLAIRSGPWKLLLGPGSGGWTKGRVATAGQLYHLDEDLAESKNLHAEQPAKVQELTTLMQRFVDQGRSTPGPAQANDAKINIQRFNAAQRDEP